MPNECGEFCDEIPAIIGNHYFDMTVGFQRTHSERVRMGSHAKNSVTLLKFAVLMTGK